MTVPSAEALEAATKLAIEKGMPLAAFLRSEAAPGLVGILRLSDVALAIEAAHRRGIEAVCDLIDDYFEASSPGAFRALREQARALAPPQEPKS